MTLQFNPNLYPILDPEKYRHPSFDEAVNQPIQMGLQGLATMREQKTAQDQRDFENAIQMYNLRNEYGTEGFNDFMNTVRPPSRGPLKMFQGQTAAAGTPDVDPGMTRPMMTPNPSGDPMNPPAGFDEAAYAKRYGTKRLKMFQEGQDRDLTRRNTQSQIDERTARVRALGQNGGKPPPGYRWTPDGSLEAIPGGPAYMKAGEKSGDMNAAFNLYSEARRGLLEGLRGTNTGPIMGRIPAFTSGQQVAQGGVAAMAPVLKQLFRVAGEGVFTDRDQQLLLDMIPTRTTNPDAITTQMENIDNIVRAKLRMPRQGGGGAVDGQGSGQSGGGRIRVRNIQTGQTGSIIESDFNPQKYERL